MKLHERAGARRFLALGATVSAALLLGSASAFGATADTVFEPFAVDSPDLQVQARFPERLADAGDLTGDGVRDVFAGNYLTSLASPGDAKAGGSPTRGLILVRSGSLRHSSEDASFRLWLLRKRVLRVAVTALVGVIALPAGRPVLFGWRAGAPVRPLRRQLVLVEL